MSEAITSPEESPYKKVIRISPGESFTLGPDESAVIGRKVTDLDKGKDVRIPENCFGVILEGTTNEDTSRFQIKIRQNSVGRYYVKNLSHTIPLFTESSLRGKQDVDPQRHLIIGSSPEQLDGSKVKWSLKQLEAKFGEEEQGESWKLEFTYSELL